MIEPALIEILKEWGLSGFLIVAIISLWRKTEANEKRMADIVGGQADLIRESVKHIERNTAVLERLERDGGP